MNRKEQRKLFLASTRGMQDAVSDAINTAHGNLDTFAVVRLFAMLRQIDKMQNEFIQQTRERHQSIAPSGVAFDDE